MNERATLMAVDKARRGAVKRLTRTIDAVETNDGDGVKIQSVNSRSDELIALGRSETTDADWRTAANGKAEAQSRVSTVSNVP